MNERDRELLRRHLEGGLTEGERAAAEELLARDAAARRYVGEHEQVWTLLGEAFEPAQGRLPASPAWRGRIVLAATQAGRRGAAPRVATRWIAGLAAGLLLALALSAWWGRERSPLHDIPAEDQNLVRYLHVLQGLDTLERLGDELDLRGDFEVWRAFEGELEGEG